MNRKSVTRKRRKELMKLGRITREKSLSRDDDGTKLPKEHRCYCVEVLINGWHLCTPENNKFNAFKYALEFGRWQAEQPPYVKKEKE